MIRYHLPVTDTNIISELIIEYFRIQILNIIIILLQLVLIFTSMSFDQIR
jgi:hypothetical protein